MANSTYTKPFNFNLNDVEFLRDQINFRPLFYMSANGLAPLINWNGIGPIYDQLGSFLWDGTTLLTGMTYTAGTRTIDPTSAIGIFGASYASVLDIAGLREVSGKFNNLTPGNADWGAIDQKFIRLANSDAAHYSSLDIIGTIAQPVTLGVDTHAQEARSLISDLQHSTVEVPTGNGQLLSLNYDTWLTTTTLTTIDSVATEGHHKKVTSTAISTTTDVTTQSFYQDAAGPHAISAPSEATRVSTDTSVVLSGGELDLTYHAQLGAYDPMNPAAYVGGLARTANTGAVDLSEARNYDYTVRFSDKTTTTPTMHSVIDYTPRMIANLVASGGVVTLKDAQNHRVDWNASSYATDPAYKAVIENWNASHPEGTGQFIDIASLVEGAAIVTDWGLVGANGGSDVQNPNNSEIYVGAANPGIAATNGIFTLFGQFFDHGLDFIGKGSAYKVVIPLAVEDPLYGVIGPDGHPTTSITITRAAVSGQDGNGNAAYVNHDSPYIDQNQTYGAVDDITQILRAWVQDPNSGAWRPGARLLDGTTLANSWTDGFGNTAKNTLPTLNELRSEIAHNGGATVGGLRADLSWDEVAGAVLHRNTDGSIAHDAQGHTISTGQPLLLDMNPTFNAAHISSAAITALNTAFSSHFSPDYVTGTPLTLGSLIAAGWLNPADFSINKTLYGAPGGAALTQAQHDAVSEIMMESVGDHYVAGDGRANENFGLTSIHHVFHEEHEYQVQNLEAAIIKQDASNDPTHSTAHDWQVAVKASASAAYDGLVSIVNGHLEAKAGVFLARDANGDYFVADGRTADHRVASYALDIDGQRISAAGSYTTADGYISWDADKVFSGAKLTVEMEYQHAAVDQYARAVSPNIQEFAGTSSGENAAVTLEYAQSIFRFGHSQLRETIDTMDPTGGVTGKIMSYALEAAFLQPGKFADVGPASIIMGMERQQSNEIDEFITPALQQGLLGQPLDLATINIARGRDLNIPNLNAFREAIGFTAYSDWLDFNANMIHPDNLVNFITAYSFDGDVAHAKAILDAYHSGMTASYTTSAGAMTSITAAEASAWLHSNKDIDKVDLWLGGLAEVHVSGGVLGETFDAVFVAQITKLMDDDRFYYLQRLINQQIGDEVINEQFKDIFERTTGTQYLNGNIFGYADAYYDFGQKALDANGLAIDASSNALAGAMAQQHKYGQIIDVHTADNGGRGLGIWSDNAVNVAENAHIMRMTAPQSLVGAGAGPTNVGEPPPPVSVAKLYIFDGRPDVTGGSTNADGTAQSGFDSSEVVVGTKYDDFIRLGPADDTAYGNDGNDIIYGGSPTTSASNGGASAGLDHLYGGAGDDILYGEDMPDLMDGGSGDDWLYGGSSGSSINGVDQLIGSEGNDHLYGGAGIDKLYGGLGDDYIYGGDDTDPFVYGGDGNDYINGDSGQDVLSGGNGSDIMDGGKGIDLIYGDEGDDILRPGDGDSQITGNGGGGDDMIGGDGVVDTGFDLVDYNQQTSAIGVDIDLTAQFAGRLPADLTPQPPNVTAAISTINVLSQLEGMVGTKNNDHLVGDSPGDATAAVSNGANWLIGGSGSDLIEGRGGNDVIIGGSIRLDTLIGSYAGRYYNDTVTTIDGASHRAIGALSGGLLDVASTGGLVFEKHFTELLKSAAYKDFVLGDGGSDGSQDMAVYTGDRKDYRVELISFDTKTTDGYVKAYKVTDKGGLNADGTDLLIGVEKISFNGVIYAVDLLVNHAPTGSVDFTGGDRWIGFGQVATQVATLSPTSAIFDANNITTSNALGAVTISNSSYKWQTSTNGAVWTDLVSGAGANQQNASNHALSYGATASTGVLIHLTASYTDAGFTSESVTSPTWNLIVGSGATGGGGNNTLNGADKSDGKSGTISDIIFGLNGNDIINGGAGDDRLFGGGGDDSLNGSAGNDYLDGGLGTNRLTGGAGDDIYVVNSASDTVDETATGSGGVDTVRSAVTYTLTSNVENLTLTGANINGTGNTLANLIIGSSGNNTLDGGSAGADALSGGLGNDTYLVSHAGMTVTEALNAGADSVSTTLAFYTLEDNVENLTYIGAGAFTGNGNALDNVIIGLSGNDTLFGLAGNDTLDGGSAGGDVLIGGNGDDTYVISHAGVQVTEAALQGTDTVLTTLGAYTLGGNLENLTYIGPRAFIGNGNALDNVISGGSGADALRGDAGNDTLNGGSGGGDLLIGGQGNDTYIVSHAGVTLTEGAQEGADTVLTTLTAYTLGSNLENLTYTGAGAFNATGNSLDNVITGGRGNDHLNGGGGNDTLISGAGRDNLTGGDGVDTFVFKSAAEAGNGTGTGSTNADLITDFQLTNDKIDLSGIDANTQSALIHTFVWDDTLETRNTRPTAGHLGYHYEGTGANAVTVIDGNINTARFGTDNTLDFQIKLAGTLVLHASDFVF